MFDQSKNTGAFDVIMDESVLDEKLSFKMLGLSFSSKLDWGAYIISIAKTASKKIGAFIHYMKFLFPEVALYLYKSTKDHVWNVNGFLPCTVWLQKSLPIELFSLSYDLSGFKSRIDTYLQTLGLF